MGRWQVQLDDGDQTRIEFVEATKWPDALEAGRIALGLDAETLQRVYARVRPDGSIVVTDPQTARHLVLSPASEDSPTPEPTTPFTDGPVATEEVPDLGLRLAGAAGIEEAAHRALLTLQEVVDAESGSVLLRRRDRLEFVAVKGPVADRVRRYLLHTDAGIAGYVYSTGRALVLHDVAGSEQHLHEMAKELGYHPQALLAVPIKQPAQQPWGVLELLRQEGSFTAKDEAYARAAAQEIAAWLAMSPEFESSPT